MSKSELIVETYNQIKREMAERHNLTDEKTIEQFADKEMEKIYANLEVMNKPYFYNEEMFYLHCLEKIESELVKYYRDDQFLSLDAYKLLKKQKYYWEIRLVVSEKNRKSH